MRRIIALVLVLTAIVVLFTACKNDSGDEMTEPPVSTSDTTVTDSTTTTAASTTGATYVLTTNSNKQAPWYSTTRFVPSGAVTVTSGNVNGQTNVSNMYDNITYPTSGAGVVTPSVSAVTSAAQSTVWSTHGSSSGSGSSQSGESTTTGTTEAVKATGKQVVIASSWFDGSGNFCAAIDKDGWGKIKSNSIRVPVYIDGVESDTPGTLQISSSVDGDGNQYIFLNTSKYDAIEFGSVISFEIPESFLKNSSGTRYNYACQVSSDGA